MITTSTKERPMLAQIGSSNQKRERGEEGKNSKGLLKLNDQLQCP